MNIQGKEFEDGVLVIRINYSRSEHAGVGGCFQIVDVYIEGETDESIAKSLDIDYGIHYSDIIDFLHDLNIDPKTIDYCIEAD